MSASQTRFGPDTVNFCSSRLGATGNRWRLSVVVGRKRRLARTRMPCRRISLPTQPRLTRWSAAHMPHRIEVGMLLDNADPHFGTSAKMPMAFLDISLHPGAIVFTAQPRDLSRLISWRECCPCAAEQIPGGSPGPA